VYSLELIEECDGVEGQEENMEGSGGSLGQEEEQPE